MLKHTDLPDVGGCTPNEPLVLVSPTQMLASFNQVSGKKRKLRVDDKVKMWYQVQAVSKGWSSVKFTGTQCVLKAVFAESPVN